MQVNTKLEEKNKALQNVSLHKTLSTIDKKTNLKKWRRFKNIYSIKHFTQTLYYKKKSIETRNKFRIDDNFIITFSKPFSVRLFDVYRRTD